MINPEKPPVLDYNEGIADTSEEESNTGDWSILEEPEFNPEESQLVEQVPSPTEETPEYEQNDKVKGNLADKFKNYLKNSKIRESIEEVKQNGDNIDSLLSSYSAKELLPNLTDEDITKNLETLLQGDIEPKDAMDRLTPYQILSKYDILEKNGAKIDINDYINNPKGGAIPHEVIAKNIDYCIERGAKFDPLLHKLSAKEVVANIDKLMKLDGADINEVENRLMIHNPSPSLAEEYMEALKPYR